MSARYDFYGPIHKGLRLGATRLMVRIGSLDLCDAAAVAALTSDFGEFLTLAQKHLEHEDREINGLMRQRAPELVEQLDQDHTHHYAAFEALDGLLAVFACATPEGRPAALRALYLGFTKHIAEDLDHMVREEEEALPVLQALFTDEELAAVEARIVQAIPFDQMLAYFRLMLPAATPQDRMSLLKALHGAMPPQVFDMVLEQAAKPSLATADWFAVEVEFRLAA